MKIKFLILSYYGTKVSVHFTKSCLKQSNHIFTHKKILNIYIVYELAASSSHTSDPSIKISLLVLGRGPTQGLESPLTAEKRYSINFTVTKKKF